MNKDELANWKRIKEVLEKEGKTDNQYYKRAVAICNGEPDPLK